MDVNSQVGFRRLPHHDHLLILAEGHRIVVISATDAESLTALCTAQISVYRFQHLCHLRVSILAIDLRDLRLLETHIIADHPPIGISGASVTFTQRCRVVIGLELGPEPPHRVPSLLGRDVAPVTPLPFHSLHALQVSDGTC